MSRPRVLDEEKRREVCALITAGMTFGRAAAYVGCSAKTIRREREQDPDFDEQVRQAKLEARLGPLETIRRAAATNWRAAAWLVDRHDREEARRREARRERVELDEAVRIVREAVREEVREEMKNAPREWAGQQHHNPAGPPPGSGRSDASARAAEFKPAAAGAPSARQADAGPAAFDNEDPTAQPQPNARRRPAEEVAFTVPDRGPNSTEICWFRDSERGAHPARDSSAGEGAGGVLSPRDAFLDKTPSDKAPAPWRNEAG